MNVLVLCEGIENYKIFILDSEMCSVLVRAVLIISICSHCCSKFCFIISYFKFYSY